MIDATDYGIVGDSVTLNTEPLQAVIDQCGEAGGGTIVFPPGRYLTGGLEMRDNVQLHLELGATLLGSATLDDYKLYKPSPVLFWEGRDGIRALLFAHQCRNIRLTGQGTVDGQGPEIQRGERAAMPRNIWFADCENVVVEDLRLRHSGFWMQQYLKCTHVRLRGIDVYNHGSCNNDGLDIDSCRDVVVSDCAIDSHDDALCIKSGDSQPAENVVITNCITRTHCNHFKLGTESNGGFRNIMVSNLQMVPSTVLESDPGTDGADYRGACGIALGCVDGGMMENIAVSHVQMDQVRVPFFIRLGDRAREIPGIDVKQPVQFARTFRISDVTARGTGPCGCYVMGLPEEPVCDVIVDRCNLEFEGGGNDALAGSVVPLSRDAYPSCDAFGDFPSYGIFMRDVKGIVLRDLRMKTLTPDARPALRWQRVENLEMNNVAAVGTVSV